MWYLFAGKENFLFALLKSRSMNCKQTLFSLAITRVFKRINCLQGNTALAFLNCISRSQQTWGEWQIRSGCHELTLIHTQSFSLNKNKSSRTVTIYRHGSILSTGDCDDMTRYGSY